MCTPPCRAAAPDATSEYLKDFPGWALDAAGSQGQINASALRDAYFGGANSSLDAVLGALVSQAPAHCLQSRPRTTPLQQSGYPSRSWPAWKTSFTTTTSTSWITSLR